MVNSGSVWLENKTDKKVRVIQVVNDEKRHVDIRQLGTIHKDFIPYDEFVEYYSLVLNPSRQNK